MTELADDPEEWMEMVAWQWYAELADAREDIYTLEDGEAPQYGSDSGPTPDTQ